MTSLTANLACFRSWGRTPGRIRIRPVASVKTLLECGFLAAQIATAARGQRNYPPEPFRIAHDRVIKQMPQLAGNDFLSALVFCQFKPVELTESWIVIVRCDEVSYLPLMILWR